MIVLVANLKPALLRGVESKGMLLAAQEGKTVEVLFVDHAQPGDRVVLARAAADVLPRTIDIDTFFTMPIAADDFSRVVVGDAALECAGKPVVTTRVVEGQGEVA